MTKFLVLLRTEGRLALRCPDALIFGMGMPTALLLFIGMIAGNKSVGGGLDYTFLESSYSSLVTVGICATALIGIPVTIADYRDKKILKHYFVTPASPMLLLAVQMVIGALTAIASATLVLLTGRLVFGYKLSGNVLLFIGSYFLLMISMYSIGMLIASLCKTVRMANIICYLVYFPMLFLSGATIPYELFPRSIKLVSNIMPLTHGIKLLKGCSIAGVSTGISTSVLILLLIIPVCGLITVKTFRWE